MNGGSEVIKVAIQEGASNLPLILTVITAAVAAIAAIAAWVNTFIANEARRQQLISDLLDYRYKEKMFRSMLALKNWYKDHEVWYNEHMDDEQAIDVAYSGEKSHLFRK
jgi:hypothetical protein